MDDPLEFSGDESPADIVAAAIKWFLNQPHPAHFNIYYENNVPWMKYELEAGDIEFVCVYRLDKMLESFYADAQQVFQENVKAKFVDAALEKLIVPVIAFCGMTSMLSGLLILQSRIFLENAEDAQLIASALFLQSLVAQKEDHLTELSVGASKVIQDWVDLGVTKFAKKKKEFLVGFMNSQPLLNIPTGAIGRPKGKTKSESARRLATAEFEKQIETEMLKQWIEKGAKPSKTSVAKGLNIGSPESHLTSFLNKCKRRDIDYLAIEERVKTLHEKTLN